MSFAICRGGSRREQLSFQGFATPLLQKGGQTHIQQHSVKHKLDPAPTPLTAPQSDFKVQEMSFPFCAPVF